MVKTVRCVDGQMSRFSQNFRGTEDCTVFLLCFDHFFLSAAVVDDFIVITKKLCLVLLRWLELLFSEFESGKISQGIYFLKPAWMRRERGP